MPDRPVPQGLEESVTLRDGRTLRLRPIRASDFAAHRDLLDHLSRDDRYFRFFRPIRSMSDTELLRYCDIDYETEMAFIAALDRVGRPETVGVVRLVFDDRRRAEFGIVVRHDYHGLGLGRLLMAKALRYAADRGALEVDGEVLPENRGMLQLAAALGFQSRFDGATRTVHVRHDLAAFRGPPGGGRD